MAINLRAGFALPLVLLAVAACEPAKIADDESPLGSSEALCDFERYVSFVRLAAAARVLVAEPSPAEVRPATAARHQPLDRAWAAGEPPTTDVFARKLVEQLRRTISENELAKFRSDPMFGELDRNGLVCLAREVAATEWLSGVVFQEHQAALLELKLRR